MKNRVKFAELLAAYRERCGWSQGELGMKLGNVHRNVIAKWESGTIPSRDKVFRLVDELQLFKEERREFLNVAGFSIEHWPADYWNVPYQHNPYFIGREAFLKSLKQRLVSGEKITALPQAISGLGGIGKTQVAIEYAHHYGNQYEAVLWIPADSLEVATAAYLQLATQVLGLPEQQKAEEQITEVKRWLQKRHGWLLIFDNVETPQEILTTFVPSKHQGSVLITTRRRDVGTFAQCEMLPLLSEDDAVLFLLRRARCIPMNANITEATSDDFFLARNLCQLLDRLPLALDQAGAYIAANGSLLQRYIDLYQQYRPKLLDRRGATDHPDSVLMTFWLSWERIQACNVLAGKALQFCAFVAPDQIPESLVQAGIMMSETENRQDTLEINDALGLLHDYSLIERTEQMLSLHRLVQEVTQEILSEEERQSWMERAVLVVNAIFPSGEHGTWPLCESLLSHALICAKWTFALRENGPEAGLLLNNIGRYLYERAQYGESESLWKQALLISEELFGIDHPEVASSLNNLAILYLSQGRYSEAELLLKRALSIQEEQLGASHPNIANNLATLYEHQGRYLEAEPLYLQALLIQEEQLGTSHPETATSLNNLATLYLSQGRYSEVEPLYLQTLSISEEQLGDSHPETATSLNNLAELYRSQGRYPEAEPLYQRAFSIREEQLGASHPETASSLDCLGTLYRSQGRYPEAEPLLKRAFSIREEQLGASHPETATSLNNLGSLYLSQGRYSEAEPLLKRALSIAEEQLGDSHPQTSISLNNLGSLYLFQRRYPETELLLKRALSIREEQLGASHPETATSLNNLAELYRSQGRYLEAEPLYLQALLIQEEQLGASHPETASSLNSLGTLYLSQGRYPEAEPLHQRALSIREEQLGASHPETATSLNDLAELHRSQGRYPEAESLHQRALSIREGQLGASHPETAESLNNLGTLYWSLKRYSEAEPLLKRALSIVEEQLGTSHPRTVGSLNNLAELYESQKRYEEAEPLYQRALVISLTSIDTEHPQTQQILMNYLTLLSHMYTNGDMAALLQLLAQSEQDDNMDEES